MNLIPVSNAAKKQIQQIFYSVKTILYKYRVIHSNNPEPAPW